MSALIPEGMEPLAVCWMCRLNLPHRVPGQCAPDQSSGWLRWLNGPTPEEWAAQYFVHPVVARPVVMPVAAMSEDYGVMRDDDGLLRFTEPQVRGTAPEPTPDGFLVPPGVAEELMQQLRDGFTRLDAWYDSQLTPAGPVPWHRRLRRACHRKVAALRDRAARRAYKLIAGDWPDDGEDDW